MITSAPLQAVVSASPPPTSIIRRITRSMRFEKSQLSVRGLLHHVAEVSLRATACSIFGVLIFLLCRDSSTFLLSTYFSRGALLLPPIYSSPLSPFYNLAVVPLGSYEKSALYFVEDFGYDTFITYL